ncbi:probable aspartic proteinase GIP2 [Cicer arietinum]|uniref:Basic 7S globulin n=1 Tax=Cicer arietinum TaxID=3827 RepID=A0A1S2XXJ2_CICAR|nr:basic 7S globulin [Cicer arietinum]
MSSSNFQLQHLITLLLFFFISSTFSQQSFRPKALVLPVTKDTSTTNQYIAQINQRTPLVPLNLVVDLGGQFLWLDCEQHYTSSTYRPARCRSAQCSLAKSTACGDCFSSPKPGCNNNTCSIFPDNTVTHTATSGELAEDVLSIQSTNGFNPTQNVAVSRFLFSCAPTSLLEGLASGASGMAGLGRTKIAFPSQLASAFSFDRKFAICFSSSDGVVLFGDGPYGFLPNVVYDSESLTYTPLLINPVSTASAFTQGEPSAEYFIGVKKIKIDDKVVSLNTSLLSINSNGIGGTKISTVDPYTVLEASIYKAVTDGFVKASVARNLTRVDSFHPFEFCYTNLGGTRLGAAVPTIELVLQNENVVWSIFGANSMVNINDEVSCLGFVNGGENVRTSIVIGGYQLDNNLLQFDLAASRLGFSSTLFGRQTGCYNFNFTSAT